MNEGQRLILTGNDGEESEAFVVEQTKINGKNYVLVEVEEDEDYGYLVLEEGEDNFFKIMENEEEAEAILKVFEELLNDSEV